ncbi:MAG: GYD domain-containing protein [Verrucomicrobiae bacterium]|nr:GYD domain-containing protein [Verrucomicrobiae bacterium]
MSLLQFTEAGAREIDKSPRRAAGFVELAAAMGVMVESQLWTTGAYDGVLIVTGRSEEAVLGALSKLAAHGYVRTENMRAFTAHEMLAIMPDNGRPQPQRKTLK